MHVGQHNLGCDVFQRTRSSKRPERSSSSGIVFLQNRDAKHNSELGDLYANGKGVPQDYKKAVKWYPTCCRTGECNLHKIILCVMYYLKDKEVPQDYKEEFKWYRLSADKATVGQCILGELYNKGQGVSQDYKEAVKWYRLSAEQGFATRTIPTWVTMYQKGQGVPQDYKEAVKWYRLAAEQEDAEAQYNLGVMYAQGTRSSKRLCVSTYVVELSASSNGDKIEQIAVEKSIVKSQCLHQQITKAQQLARNWKPGDRIKIAESTSTPQPIKYSTSTT